LNRVLAEDLLDQNQNELLDKNLPICCCFSIKKFLLRLIMNSCPKKYFYGIKIKKAYHFSSTRIVIIKKITKGAGENEKNIGTSIHVRNIKWYYTLENSLAIPQHFGINHL
jgi:hypothetical protein